MVLQHRLHIPHMTSPKYQAYFAEAYAMCEEFRMLHIMGLHQDYDEELVGKFYTTVHVGDERNSVLRWMIKEEHVECKWSDFAACLGYPRTLGSNGWTVHHKDRPSCKDVLLPDRKSVV